MEQALLEAATTQGIWVLLFVSLFLYTIKNNEKVVDKIVEGIKESVENIEKKIEDISEKIR